MLQNYRAINGVGNKLKLQFANNNAPGQDWTIYLQGSVDRFYHFGLVSGNLAFHYGHEPAYELQWSPYGVNTGLCQGTGAPAANGRKVTLQVCGVNANTVWVLDFQDSPYLNPISGVFVPVIARLRRPTSATRRCRARAHRRRSRCSPSASTRSRTGRWPTTSCGGPTRA